MPQRDEGAGQEDLEDPAALLDGLGDGIFRFEGDCCVGVSAAGASLLGATPESLVGRSAADLARRFRARRAGAGPAGGPPGSGAEPFHVRYTRADGLSAVACVRRVAASGTVAYVARDATFEWEARAALDAALAESRVQEDRLHAIIERIPVAVAIWDAQGRLIGRNPRAAALLGLAGAPAEGGVWPALDGRFRGEGGPVHRALHGDEVWQEDLLVPGPGGAMRELVASAAPLRGPDGQIAEAVCVFEDVTERRRLERLREGFVAILAHELRNPLAALQISVQAAALALGARAEPGAPPHAARLPEGASVEAPDPPGPGGGRAPAPERPAGAAHPAGAGRPAAGQARSIRLLEQARQQAARLAVLVEQLLESGRVGEGRPALCAVPVELVGVCRASLQESARRDGRHTYALSGAPAELTVRADARRVAQVLGHLLSNARKYSPPGSPIALEIARRGGWAVVEVRDRGIGVPDGERERIFDGFYRGDEVRGADGPPGLGLGLYVTRALIREHGGDVAVARNPGGGTVVRFTLPLLEEAPA